MSDNQNIENIKAINFLCEFINEEVLGNDKPRDFSAEKIEEKKEFLIKYIDKLFKFSLWNIKNKKKYFYKEYEDDIDIDGDRTKISYIIYYLLWGDEISNIEKSKMKDFIPSSFIENNYHSNLDIDFSGDTICTFNTLFRKDSIYWFLRKNIHLGKIVKIDNLKYFSFEELNKIYNYFLLYQSLGNFYLLPKRTIGRKSINSYRGNIKLWKDYFDTFLENLKEKLDKHKFINEDFDRLIELNNFFFDDIKTYGNFIDFFMLEDFKDYKLSEHYDSNNYCEKDYVKFALEYIDKSSKCIEKRAERMIEALKEKLKLVK